jgi:hypothetical protein
MSVMLLPWAAEAAAMTPAPDLAPLLEELAALRRADAALRTENGTLRAKNVVLRERVRELESRLGQTSGNSSRPCPILPRCLGLDHTILCRRFP